MCPWGRKESDTAEQLTYSNTFWGPIKQRSKEGLGGTSHPMSFSLKESKKMMV